MADLVIRGMAMPKVCIDNGWYGNCPMDRSWCAQRFAPKDSTNESAHKDQWNKLPSWCPLVPLPEGHGRLIDAERFRVILCRLKERQNDDVAIHALNWAIECLDKLDTIVPAEGGTDDA